MKISYAVTVCNELLELQRLLSFLIENKREVDEIVVFYDTKNGSKSVEEYLRARSVNKVPFRWIGYHFDGHFANMKNALTEACLGDYIFQIDADEIPHKSLIEQLPILLEHNSAVELYAVPRVNTVEGLTQEHIQKWGWRVDENSWVNWPDFQTRIYKRSPEIRWKNKVHEVIEGHKEFAYLPMEEEWALYHPKDIKRQEKQNAYYNTL
jgi:hypothetical protein